MKGLRIAKANNIEQANRYLEHEFLAWWNQHLKVQTANATWCGSNNGWMARYWARWGEAFVTIEEC